MTAPGRAGVVTSSATYDRGVDVPVRDAATVLLLRDGSDGLEVWLQRRPPTMVFAADVHVFPGGAVEPGDAACTVDEPTLTRHASVWQDADPVRVAALAGAAIREVREESGVQLDASALAPWSRWITPVGMPRRFDARFFLAACPGGQVPGADSHEVVLAGWLVVTSAVDRFERGELPMWPPTIANLVALAPHDDVASALAAAPDRIEAVQG